MLWRPFFGACALALLLTAPGKASLAAADCAAPPSSLGEFEVTEDGMDAPNTPFLLADGKQATLGDYMGSGIVLNFWATWCAPCVKEMPALDRLSSEIDPQSVRVITLSADRGGEPVVRKFYARNGLEALPVALDEKSRVARALGVLGLPTTILFDGNGREKGRVVGIAEWDHPDTIAYLQSCISRPATAG